MAPRTSHDRSSLRKKVRAARYNAIALPCRMLRIVSAERGKPGLVRRIVDLGHCANAVALHGPQTVSNRNGGSAPLRTPHPPHVLPLAPHVSDKRSAASCRWIGYSANPGFGQKASLEHLSQNKPPAGRAGASGLRPGAGSGVDGFLAEMLDQQVIDHGAVFVPL